MFKCGPLFYANYSSKADKVVNQGGTSSAKTYEVLHTLFTKLSEDTKKICTVVGQDIPNLKAGALRDALDIYGNSSFLQKLIKSYNKTDRIFEYHNGSIMEFKSYENEQDARSGKRDLLYINEANGIAYPVYEQLSIRTKGQEFLDYNPSAQFWVHENLIGMPGVELLISDHRHNPFLPQKIRDKIEGLKDKDIELWKVYARGLTGKIEGLVLRNWNLCDKIPEGAKFIGAGMDFGFTNDPTTFIEVYMQDGQLWIQERLFATGLTNQDICNRLISESIPKHRGIIADSAEPKSIEEIRRMGWQIEPAAKGPDSINISIGVLKNYVLNITKSSINLRKELMNYKWKVDRATGNPTNEPVDYFNHCIDALRYIALNRLRQPTDRPKTFLPSK